MTSAARIEYPLGYRRRRDEALSLLIGMFRVCAARTFRSKQAVAIVDLCLDAKRLSAMPVDEFVDMMVIW